MRKPMRLGNNNFVIFCLLPPPKSIRKHLVMTSLSHYHKYALRIFLQNQAESYQGLDSHQVQGHSADRV